MIPRRYCVLLVAVPAILLQLVMIAALDLSRIDSDTLAYLLIGFFFGCPFGQVTLAAAWAALGPGRIVWRVPLSLLWVAMLPVAIAINIGIHVGDSTSVPALIGASLFGQWLLVQLPLWALAVGYGLRVRHEDDWEDVCDPRGRQFSVRELLIVTTMVAAVFGAGRISAGWIGASFLREAAIFIFLAVAAVILTLPLLLAGLLPRGAVWSVCVVLALIGLATTWEVTVLRVLPGGGQPGPETWHFVAINVFTAMTILGGVLIVRLNGYGTTKP